MSVIVNETIVLVDTEAVVINASVIETVTVVNTINASTNTIVSEAVTIVANTDSYFTVLTNEDSTPIIVYAGSQGLPGVNEEDIMYSKRIDFVTDNNIFKGEAAVGSLESLAVWRIRQLVIASDSDVTETWASGDALFNKVWANRATYAYS